MKQHRFGLDLGKFQKVSHNKDHAVLKHEHGHEIKVSLKALSPKMRAQMIEMPAMSDGGEVEDKKELEIEPIESDEMSVEELKKPEPKEHIAYEKLAKGGDVSPKIDPEKAKQMQAGATQSGYQPAQWGKNIKEGLGLADGGAIPIASDPNQVQLPESQVNPEAGAQFAASQTPIGQAPQELPYGVKPEDLQQMAPNMSSAVPQSANPASLQPNIDSAQPNTDIPQGNMLPSQPGPSLQHGYEQQQAGIQKAANAQSMMAHEEESKLKAGIEAQQNIAQDFQTHLGAINHDIDSTIQDIKAAHIDPNHLWDSKSTGGKIATVIGLVLGGINTTTRPNAALEFFNKQVDEDIDAQKANLNNKNSLLNAYFHKFGNLQDATQMAKMTQQSILADQLKQAAAKAASPMARANALQAAGRLEQQVGPAMQNFALMQTLKSGGKSMENMDPAQLVPHVVPKEHQNEVFKEVERAQNTQRMGTAIKAAFQDAAKAVSGTGALTAMVKHPRELNALHQLISTTVTDLTGTARQAEFDAVEKNLLPNQYDSKKDIATKSAALDKYLEAKGSAPTAKAYGIDLSKFKSTKPAESPAEIKTVNGVQYQKAPGGWKKI